MAVAPPLPSPSSPVFGRADGASGATVARGRKAGVLRKVLCGLKRFERCPVGYEEGGRQVLLSQRLVTSGEVVVAPCLLCGPYLSCGPCRPRRRGDVRMAWGWGRAPFTAQPWWRWAVLSANDSSVLLLVFLLRTRAPRWVVEWPLGVWLERTVVRDCGEVGRCHCLTSHREGLGANRRIKGQ